MDLSYSVVGCCQFGCHCIDGMTVLYFCLFKQKSAYEMRISDWSSDVCSSDLQRCALRATTMPTCSTPTRTCSIVSTTMRPRSTIPNPEMTGTRSEERREGEE